MKISKILLCMMALVVAYSLATTPAVAARESSMPSKATIDKNVDACLNRFYKQVPGAKEAVDKAKAVLVMPGVFKMGFIVGGQFGVGALRGGGMTAGYYNLVAGSVGMQIGGQKMDIIILFNNDAAVEKFKNTQGWEAGADANVTAANVGAGLRVDWTKIHDDIVSFVFGARGLMADASVKGGKFSRIEPK
jgi:lipid-binding SYLF domain-containing protein